jgi:sodium-dependent dicarboxylate transporter 2/3/5
MRPWVLLGLAILAAFALLPSSLHSLSECGSRPALAAGVAAMMALWWLTEALPMAVTACAPLLFFPALGVFDGGVVHNVKESVAPFFDAYIFLFMGGMTLGAAMEESQLHRRIALLIMQRIGTRPPQLLAGMLVATAAISLWISNTATTVMMLPIAMALLSQMRRQSPGAHLERFGCAVMLAVAWGSNIGGMGTKIGTGTNSIFCGFAARVLHRDLGFLAGFFY